MKTLPVPPLTFPPLLAAVLAAMGMISTFQTAEGVGTDVTKPSLTVAAPPAAVPMPARYSGVPSSPKVSAAWPYLVSGVAKDAAGIQRVEVSLNGAAPVAATLGSGAVATSRPYSVNVEPTDGPNTLVITAFDQNGLSTVVTRKFTFVRRYLLKFGSNAAAGGAVALAASGSSGAAPMLPGTAAKLTAAPKTGYVFKDWSGLPAGAGALGNTAAFSMPAADTEVTGEFIETPFEPPVGFDTRFFGLIQPTGGTPASNGTVGFFTGVLLPTGNFTGKLSIDGTVQPIVASFFGDGSSVALAGATKKESLTFGSRTLTLSYDDDKITAVVVNGAHTSEGVACRAVAQPGAALYNLVLPAKAQTPAMDKSLYPQGYGVATVRMVNTGAVVVIGTLADGSALVATSAVLPGGICPFFMPINGPDVIGSFSGLLTFDSAQADSDVAGSDLLWFRSASSRPPYRPYRAGWPNGLVVDAVGTLQTPVIVDYGAILGLGAPDAVNGNAKLTFEDGKLPAPIIKTNFNIQGYAVTKIPALDLSFNLTLGGAMGTFGGDFRVGTPPAAVRKSTFKGLVLRKGANKGGYGFFLSGVTVGDGSTESGSVTLGAP